LAISLDRGLDRLEVGHHATQPAAIHERHAAALSLGGDQFTSGPLGAHEKHGSTARGDLAQILAGFEIFLDRALQIDDMDLVALTEDVLGHLRVPIPGLVAKMDTGL
jgi:hypothetical protein